MTGKEMENEKKKLNNLILEALKLKGMNLEKLSQLTGVSEHSLALLLEEQFDKLPPAPYVRGYLLKIAEVLNLDGRELWREYLKNNEEIRRSGKEDILPLNRFAIPKLNKKIVAISGAVILFVALVIFRLPAFFGQPELEISNIDENPTIVREATFAVRGIMNPTDELMINGEVIYPQKDGNFEKNILLQPGFNNVVFQIKKLLGRVYMVEKQIFYQTKEKNETQ
ncbi:MAG: helix-turn-helix domain-containing protein [Patescibacteria group bacterium]